jgi:hypothetical protein
LLRHASCASRTNGSNKLRLHINGNFARLLAIGRRSRFARLTRTTAIDFAAFDSTFCRTAHRTFINPAFL